ncbi:hypothetical protein A5821_000795 [Enterococcus sp. 7F3_DIV0205]|uniref:DUF998 domain-containing protein n=1 Tax=Candidatus Enterococcus palustris TaxID=1834189 RepID=A0AAQ3W7P9_9ENTE|nr:DUF998 domain-containing protein [Enterococcus sp. 7F3_DIV0205]OTN85210.1 hypothetical protein A5821_001139 [Enterococcus sp. 7F3_DIV0205]
MKMLHKYGFFIMILVIISEFTFPWIFAIFYPGYNHITMLISDFGEDGSPTRIGFKIWQLIDGSLLLLTIPSFYTRFKNTSTSLATWLSIMMTGFALGDCFVTALFDRSTNLSKIDIESIVHDYLSGIGFIALLIATFILMKLYGLEKNYLFVQKLRIIFIITICFMLLFAAPKIPLVNKIPIPYRGLWQRTNLLFLYLPFFLVALKNLPKKK